jgi:Zn-dependent metalloprotease
MPGGKKLLNHCIVPPYLLEAIQVNGTPQQREWAADALRLGQAARTARVQAPSGPAAVGSGTARRNIYDAKTTLSLPGTLVRSEGDPPTSDIEVNEAYDGIGATRDFYSEVYSRDSVDGAGLALNGTVHYRSRYDNAQWNGTQMLFGDGDGTIFNRFTIAVDIMGHELTHGVNPLHCRSHVQRSAGCTERVHLGCLRVDGQAISRYATADR